MELNETLLKDSTKLLTSWITRFGPVSTFREVAKLGLTHALEKKQWLWTSTIASFATNPEWRQYMKDPDDYLSSGSGDSLLKEMVKCDYDYFVSSVDAACLIFAHSAVDAVAWECCRLSAVVSPSDWHDAVKKRTVAVGDLENTDYQDIMDKKVGEYIDSLERESLLKKVDLYHKRCWVDDALSNFIFDRERLVELDGLRHDVVHGDRRSMRLPKGDDDITFLQKTCLHLAVTLFKKYNLRWDEKYLQGP